MDWLTDALLAFVADTNNPMGLTIIGLSAMVEYIFPPFPGDTITLAGAVLITSHGWSFVWVFGVVMLGSVVGSMVDFYIGRRLETRSSHKEQSERNQTVQKLIRKFERHGAVYLVINRFLPGIRALFFVAAGMAGMRPAAVLFYSAVSSALWNLGLIALGSALGLEFESMKELATNYSVVVWIALAVVATVLITRALLRRRRAPKD